jgi:hypothetical protein
VARCDSFIIEGMSLNTSAHRAPVHVRAGASFLGAVAAMYGKSHSDVGTATLLLQSWLWIEPVSSLSPVRALMPVGIRAFRRIRSAPSFRSVVLFGLQRSFPHDAICKLSCGVAALFHSGEKRRPR